MYRPAMFDEKNHAPIHDLIDANPFGELIVFRAEDSEPDVTHVPFVLDRNAGTLGRLRLHVAKANPIWKTAFEAEKALAVFAGPHGYVSPRWYEEPTQQVPTWNYAVAHVHGTPARMDAAELRLLLEDLVRINEGDEPDAWRFELLVPHLREKLLNGIVGISIQITRLEGKFKLSQNRSPGDRARVLAQLRLRAGPGDLELAELMSRRELDRA